MHVNAKNTHARAHTGTRRRREKVKRLRIVKILKEKGRENNMTRKEVVISEERGREGKGS